MTRLSSNSELYNYLIALADVLEGRSDTTLAESVRFAARQATGLSTEFIVKYGDVKSISNYANYGNSALYLTVPRRSHKMQGSIGVKCTFNVVATFRAFSRVALRGSHAPMQEKIRRSFCLTGFDQTA